MALFNISVSIKTWRDNQPGWYPWEIVDVTESRSRSKNLAH